MAFRPSGQWALMQTGDKPERFVFLHLDPARVGEPGYVWSSSAEMDEEQVQTTLVEMELDLRAIARVFVVARALFAAGGAERHR